VTVFSSPFRLQGNHNQWSQGEQVNTSSIFNRFARQAQFGLLGLALIGIAAPHARAQEGASHNGMQHKKPTAKIEEAEPGTLIEVIRQSTERFKNVNVALAEGYALQFGCVTGPDSGAMGLHYVNMNLVASGTLDPTRPQIVIYEPVEGGGLKLIGADFLVIADDWNKRNQGPPQMMGQWFHLFDAPNRFGLPAFYTLHVWAWKDNPNGAFVNWHPDVSCSTYKPKPF